LPKFLLLHALLLFPKILKIGMLKGLVGREPLIGVVGEKFF
jgi:hypothetical protein